MKAVILAGGKGRRLHPFTVAFPKPLVPVGHQAVLEIILRRLAAAGVHEVILSIDHFAEMIMAYIEGNPSLRALLDISYARDEKPGGTAGPLADIAGLDTPFLVMNGDVMTTIDIADLIAHHKASGAAVTIAVHQKEVAIDLGVLDISGERIVGYREKPKLNLDVSMGIYVYEPRALKFITKGDYLDFPDLVLRLLAAGEHVGAYATDASWLDIGRPEDYAKAQALFGDGGLGA
ncbi:NDP-sugar pyrophosphorylase family protein [Agrobacterium vitis]|nr:NDP-sugar pyrophosphorylase family protein [Agrobacterium vitis]MBE1436628.1 NDP-sugar pyrophosphorylase family protein [Agrobacterium vitis]